MVEHALRGNLSGEPNAFIGRERELSELLRIAPAARALTLCGAGGIGKTRLAVRMLAALADDFPDGVWFVEFADLQQPDLVESRIASVIGVTEEPGRPLIETLADVLRPRQMLLALDNCEHLIDSCARVCQRLLASSPGLRVIVTSREPLRVAAETVWQVPPLWLPAAGADSDELLRSDAIRLFADRAAAARASYAVDTGDPGISLLAAVCRVLDGLPLAIELAAAWVRVLSIEQIAARLDDRFRLLRSGERTVQPRQRTLRATIDWSHNLLTRREQVLLRRLSAFAGWSLEMAEQLCGDDDLPARQVIDLLIALADKSLVVVETDAHGETRHRMLDTIRAYAASRLADAGESVMMQDRLRDYAVGEVEHLARIGMALIRAPWSARLVAFRRFEAEAGNLRQVLSRCVDENDAETGMRICAAMRPIWIVHGSFAEGAEWFDAFLGLDAPGVPPGMRGAALIGRAQLALAADPDAARDGAQAGLALCRAAGEGFWISTALNLLAEIALHAGRLDESAAAADEAIGVSRQAGDPWNEGYALGTAGAVAALRGDLAEARRLAEMALAVMRDIDQQWGVARTLLGLGDLARLTGEPDVALRRYTEALAILREVDARPEIARCLAGLGRIAMGQGDLALARQQLAESIDLSQSAGSRIGVIRALDSFAALAVKEGRPERAVRLAAAAEALRAAAHLPPASAGRTQRILDAGAGLGEEAVGQLWAAGSELTSAAAVELALDGPLLTPEDAAVRESNGRVRLTERERQIVALIARGCSNKVIAEELFISPATAARHVANIMGKLGFTSRAQIAVWAQRPGARAHGQRPGPRDRPSRRAAQNT
ncbi:MAG TPA: tetratricopeptide repeat protein [Streptosporangiaceae bacterium]|nr:tetratricopeptide repeat protein [Streptosporangiaceae bacterium]